jgi:hypothetical protein
MLISVVTKRRFKVLAVFLAVNIIAQIGFPTLAFALTRGASQPAAGSFEAVNTNQMVDLFSGDLTYNIPLMNVPGPNGGYPINLAYNAGVGMEQEASWVGLGWNVNAGVINRNLRGMPDDFKGDKVTKTLHMKPQRKISATITAANLENFGFDLAKGTLKIGLSATAYYDNYKGVGTAFGVNLSSSSAEMFGGGMTAGLSLTSDSKEGLGVSPSLSYGRGTKEKGSSFELGLEMNSRQGLTGITFRSNRWNSGNPEIGPPDPNSKATASGAATTFSNSTFVPIMDMPRGGFSGSLDFKMGPKPLP